jgi:aryl-alcohol dehydrogenase-like predicted oxidoreductase/enamine deaminase RidA (YjgF/YER057c/UK114 family)
MEAVERCELAPGLTISRVVTGLWQIADMERRGTPLDAGTTAAAMRPYVEAGFTTFDMADHYGSAEEIAGRHRQRFADSSEVQLLTKWVPAPGPLDGAVVRTAVHRSLERLRTDRIDLLQFHVWKYDDPCWLDSLFHLQLLKDEGLIGHIGLTNVDCAHLRIAVHSGIDIVSNQVCFSLLDRRAAGAMTQLCLESGVRLLAYGAVAGGLLTERWLAAPEPDVNMLDTWSQMKYRRFIAVIGGWAAFQRLLESVNDVARRHGVSMANVACRYVLDRPAVAAVIVGARLGHVDHIEDNRRLFEFSLDEASMAELNAAASVLSTVPGDCGDEYRRPPYLTAAGDLSHHLSGFPAPYPVRTAPDGRTRVLSGTSWEEIGGYCRAIRRGDRILVSGTTATHGSRPIGGADPEAQTHFIIDKIEGAIRSLGGRLDDVLRTRILVRPGVDWEPVARAHGLRFGEIQPANTLVHADLVGDECLVEIEAEAHVEDRL